MRFILTVGMYRIDLYIVDLNIAIECDESGHSGYDDEREIQRTGYIEKCLLGVTVNGSDLIPIRKISGSLRYSIVYCILGLSVLVSRHWRN